MDQLDFLKGALIGGCLGGVVALLLAPKSGRELMGDISEGYSYMMPSKKIEGAKGYATEVKENVKNFLDSLSMQTDSSHAFLIGGLSGAIIGAIAGLLIAPEAGSKLRARLGNNYDDIYEKAKDVVEGIKDKTGDFEDKIDEWKEIFETLVDKLTSSKSKKPQGVHLNNILDWATLGLRAYNQMKLRR